MTASAAWASLSLHDAPNYDDSAPRLPAYYVEASAEPTIGDSGLRLSAHVGTSWGRYWTETIGHSYSDYALGAKQTIGAMEISLRFVGTHRYAQLPDHAPLSGASRIVLSLTVTNSW